jgi:hypothetical protein
MGIAEPARGSFILTMGLAEMDRRCQGVVSENWIRDRSRRFLMVEAEQSAGVSENLCKLTRWAT